MSKKEYELVLSLAERKAIDWIGHRYFHGDDLHELLNKASWIGEGQLDDDEAE